MKIALLNTYRVIQGRGGAEKVFCELANGFAQCGHEVLALAYDEAEGRPFYPLDSRVIFMNTWSGRNVLLSVVEKVKTFSFSKEIRRDRRRKLQQRKLFIDRTEKVVLAIREFSPDVILSFQISSSGYIKDGVGDIPVVTMLHGHPDFYEIEEEQKDILRKSRRVQVLLPQYEAIFKAKFSKDPPEVVCIHNSVPVYKELLRVSTNRMSPRREPIALAREILETYLLRLLISDGMGKKILHIGRIAPEKRQHLLVEAFSLLQKDFPDWTLELWGERSDLEYDRFVCDVIRKCGMNPDSVLKGVSSNVENILKSGSIFVFPSSVEGFPLALTEAMSMGLCCVGCCDCLSVSTLVKDDYSGILTQPNGKDLAEAIKKAMTTPSMRINFGRNASSDMKKYSKERVVEEWISLFEELVTRRR